MGDSYQRLADSYDDLQHEIDYAAWADFICRLDRRDNQRAARGDGRDGRPILLDLGCGTGTFCLAMEQRGFDVIGIDRSAPMLQQAREKAQAADSSALFLQQDISRFELYGTVDLAVCLLDTLNHLTRPPAVERVFQLLANYLNPGSLFIADVGTRHHFARTLGNRMFYQDHDDLTLIWHNQYRESTGISRSSLTWFKRTPDGDYTRFDEEVSERYYDHAFLLKAARLAGLEFVGRTGELSEQQPKASSERHFYIFRRRTDT
jgi:SAM-dependent methyltransferase